MAELPDIITTADIHVTPRSEHAYRWTVFDNLRQLAAEPRVGLVIIAGDLTDAKDRHEAALVRRLTDEIASLAALGVTVVVTKGNHDYMEEDTPFFGFLNHVDGVIYVRDPISLNLAQRNILFVPHLAREKWHQTSGWRKKTDFRDFDLIVCHQTFDGAVASSGIALPSPVTPSILSKANVGDALVISGDIHGPQRIGNVEYIGSPHPINYGDDYECRFLRIRDRSLRPIPRKGVPRRTVIRYSYDGEELVELEDKVKHLVAADCVKVRVEGECHHAGHWPRIKRELLAQFNAKHVNVGGLEWITEQAAVARVSFDDDATDDDGRMMTDEEYFEAHVRKLELDDETLELGRALL